MPGRTPQPLAVRFAAMVEIGQSSSDCWIWIGSLRGGYGQIRVRTDNGWSVVGAHRVSFELHRGEIPEGLVLDHLCRNTICVNPAHLEPVTQKENVLRGDALSAINARKAHCVDGHAFGEVRYPNGSRRCVVCDPIVGGTSGTCAGCSTPFTRGRGGRPRRFCSDSCRIRFHNQRKAAA